MKWLEAAGAQVVPIIISIDDNEDMTEYFQEVDELKVIVTGLVRDFWLNKMFFQVFAGINGLLIPGGATSIAHSGYADASNAFFKMAKEVFQSTFAFSTQLQTAGKLGRRLLPNLGNLSRI